MNRALALALLVTGCASGSASGVADSPSGGGNHDAPVAIDSPVAIDAPHAIDAAQTHDAPIDAHVAIDAPVPIDAPRAVDAPPPPVDAPPPPPDACVPHATQLLQNPTFDLSPAGTAWTETVIDPAAPLITSDGPAPQSAPFQVFLGGITGEDEGTDSVTDVLTQDVAIPAGTTKLEITGFWLVGTTETGTIVFDRADVALTRTDGTPIEDILALTNVTTSTAYTAFDHVFATPATLAGTTVRLRLTSTNDITNNTNFFFDTFALTATHCP